MFLSLNHRITYVLTPPLVGIRVKHSQIAQNHIYQIAVQTKIYLFQISKYIYKIIYSVIKYICDNSLFFTLNQCS